MPKPCPEVVALLERLTREARAGRLHDVFVLFRESGGEYGFDYLADDPPDLLFELGTVILQERGAGMVGSRR